MPLFFLKVFLGTLTFFFLRVTCGFDNNLEASGTSPSGLQELKVPIRDLGPARANPFSLNSLGPPLNRAVLLPSIFLFPYKTEHKELLSP